jgi:hypothetical protein
LTVITLFKAQLPGLKIPTPDAIPTDSISAIVGTIIPVVIVAVFALFIAVLTTTDVSTDDSVTAPCSKAIIGTGIVVDEVGVVAFFVARSSWKKPILLTMNPITTCCFKAVV